MRDFGALVTARTPEGRALLALIDGLVVSVLGKVNPGKQTLADARKEAAGCVERLEAGAPSTPAPAVTTRLETSRSWLGKAAKKALRAMAGRES